MVFFRHLKLQCSYFACVFLIICALIFVYTSESESVPDFSSPATSLVDELPGAVGQTLVVQTEGHKIDLGHEGVGKELIRPEATIPNFVNQNWMKAGLPADKPSFSEEVLLTDFGGVAGDGADDSEAFKRALSSVSEDTPLAVIIPEGVFNLENSVFVPGKRLIRGAGPDKTIIKLSHTGHSFHSSAAQTGKWQPILRGYEKGSSKIYVADPTGIKPGSFIEIAQENDPDVMYTKPEWDQPWAALSVGQVLRVMSVTDNVVTFEYPLNISFNSSLNPQFRVKPMVQWVGFENFKVDGTDADVSDTKSTLDFRHVAFVWVNNVESAWTDKLHFLGLSLYHCEVTGNFFHDSHDFGGGGHGYGVGISRRTTGCLVENNTFDTLRHSMLLSSGSNGNVFSYNYSKNPTWQWLTPPGDLSIHGHYSFQNLFEGNVLQKIWVADYWGPAGPGNLYYRNCVERYGIQVDEPSHDQAIIGNVLHRGSLTVQDPEVRLLIHGNRVKDEVQLIGGWVFDMPESYYLAEKPGFLQEYNWPPVSAVSGKCHVPAQLREN